MSEVNYRVFPDEDVPPPLGPIVVPAWANLSWHIVREEDGIPVEIIGSDGGEPEDQLLVRDWDWVAPALKSAYELGKKHGKEEGDDDANP